MREVCSSLVGAGGLLIDQLAEIDGFKDGTNTPGAEVCSLLAS